MRLRFECKIISEVNLSVYVIIFANGDNTMNFSSIPFSLLTLLLLFAALLILLLWSGAAGILYLAFAPALLWGVMVAIRGRS